MTLDAGVVREPSPVPVPALPWPVELYALGRTFIAEETAGAIRHDVVDQLNAVANACFGLDQAARERGPEGDLEKLSRMLLGGVERATKLLGRSFLPPPVVPRDLPDVLVLARALVASMEPVPDVPVDCPAARGGLVCADSQEVALAIFCLVENAVDAIREGRRGGVRISAEPHREDMVALVVEDDGPGLSPHAEDHAFDPFFGTKPGRLGLGLAITRRIAYRWGGWVELGSREPSGVRAILILPGRPR